jgi:MFS transporter, putative metabolite:H+ symporter
MLIGLIGIPAAALMARLAIPAAPWGWRLVFVWGAPGLIFPFLARKLEESPRWYEKRGQFMAQCIEQRASAEVGHLSPADVSMVEPHEGKFSELFAPAMRGRTAMMVAAWIFQTLRPYGFSAWVPTLLVEHG